MHLSHKPLLTLHEIQRQVAQLGREISAAYHGRDLVLIVVLKGSAMFAMDLVRTFHFPVTLDFIRVKSYQGTEAAAPPEFRMLPDVPLAGRDVLVIEDILDTGHTCAAVLAKLQELNPATLKVVTLLDKPSRRQTPVQADFRGFTIEDHFVVGYGLDYDEQYRQLPAIHVLEEQ